MRRREHKEKPSQSRTSDAFFQPAVQKKLAVGKPGDKFEKEADNVADKVVSKTGGGDIQRAVMPGEEEKVQQKPLAESVSSVQKKDLKEDEQPVQKAAEVKEDEKGVQKKEEEPKDDATVQQKEEDEQPVQKAAEVKEDEKGVQKKEEEPQDDATIQQKEEDEQPVQKAAEVREDEKGVQKKEEEPKDDAAVQQKKDDEQPVQKAAEVKEDEKAVQKKEEEQEKPLQKKEEEEKLQAKETAAPTKSTSKSKAAGTNVESRLNASKGNGNPMQGSVKSEMEAGFGKSFNDVNIHTDTSATQMSQDMGALAFTHGKDIYFNSGQYDPHSPEGKVLLAHELTHTIQQEGAKDLDPAANNSSLENDADTSTRGFVGRMMGGIGKAGKGIMPKLKSGLRIARCEPSARDKALAEFKKKRAAGSTTLPAAQPGIKTAAVSLGKDSKAMDSYQRFQDKEKKGGDLVWGFFFSKDKSLKSAVKKPAKLETWSDFNGFSSIQRSTLFQISRITGEVVHNKYSETSKNLELLKKAYDYWPADQFAVHQSGSAEASNTCNVFVGNSLFNAGFTGNNKGKFFSAAEVYAGANGAFAEIDKAFTQPGDIVAYGGHVGVVVTVDPGSEKFVTREGYITPKGSERVRNFDELLGLEHPELKIMRKK